MRGGQVDIPAHTTPAPLPLVAAKSLKRQGIPKRAARGRAFWSKMKSGETSVGGRLRFDQYLTDTFNTVVFGPLREKSEDDRFVMAKPTPLPRQSQPASPPGQRR